MGGGLLSEALLFAPDRATLMALLGGAAGRVRYLVKDTGLEEKRS